MLGVLVVVASPVPAPTYVYLLFVYRPLTPRRMRLWWEYFAWRKSQRTPDLEMIPLLDRFLSELHRSVSSPDATPRQLADVRFLPFPR